MKKRGRKISRGFWKGCGVITARRPTIKMQSDDAALLEWWRAHDDPADAQLALPVPDGVYVDASVKQSTTTLGFAVVRSGKVVDIFSTDSKFRSSGSAEMESVRLARLMFPVVPIYCDSISVCLKFKKFGVHHVSRNQNPSHRAAYRRINFRERSAIESSVKVDR